MGQVTSTAERVIDAPAATVRAALADYAEVRPQILTPEFSDYRVESGGQGAGTRAHWKLAATKKRVRAPSRRGRRVDRRVDRRARRQLQHGHHLDGRAGRSRS
jgi:hypothetical protein